MPQRKSLVDLDESGSRSSLLRLFLWETFPGNVQTAKEWSSCKGEARNSQVDRTLSSTALHEKQSLNNVFCPWTNP